MSILICALVASSFATNNQPTEPITVSPLAAFLAPTPAASAAQDKSDAADSLLSYTYAELGAAQNDVEDFDEDVDIYYLRGSFNITLFYVYGEYSNQSTDFEDTDTDLLELGVGAHFGVLPAMDVYAQVGAMFSDVSSDLDDLEDSDTGYRLEGGARWMVLPWATGGLEIDGKIGQISLDNNLSSDDDPVYYGVGARVHFLKFLSVGAEYQKIEDDDMILGNVRWSF